MWPGGQGQQLTPQQQALLQQLMYQRVMGQTPAAGTGGPMGALPGGQNAAQALLAGQGPQAGRQPAAAPALGPGASPTPGGINPMLLQYLQGRGGGLDPQILQQLLGGQGQTPGQGPGQISPQLLQLLLAMRGQQQGGGP